MKLSKNSEYALRIMLYFAKKGNDAIIQNKEISVNEEISKFIVDQITSRLRRAGLIKSIRGCEGGYKLAKPKNSITIGNIVKAIEGNINILNCCKDSSMCKKSSFCKPHSIWKEINYKIQKLLEKYKLGDI